MRLVNITRQIWCIHSTSYRCVCLQCAISRDLRHCTHAPSKFQFVLRTWLPLASCLNLICADSQIRKLFVCKHGAGSPGLLHSLQTGSSHTEAMHTVQECNKDKKFRRLISVLIDNAWASPCYLTTGMSHAEVFMQI